MKVIVKIAREDFRTVSSAFSGIFAPKFCPTNVDVATINPSKKSQEKERARIPKPKAARALVPKRATTLKVTFPVIGRATAWIPLGNPMDKIFLMIFPFNLDFFKDGIWM